MRLIDADALKAYIDAQKGRPWIGCTIGEALKIMTDEQPTIEPQRTGKWIEYDNSHCECPLCHEEWSYFDNDVERFNYCPNCGAKME